MNCDVGLKLHIYSHIGLNSTQLQEQDNPVKWPDFSQRLIVNVSVGILIPWAFPACAQEALWKARTSEHLVQDG